MTRRYASAIVVALIVLLCAGLLLPALHQTRKAAMRMSCHSNFKGLALALHMHADSHQGALPAGTVPNESLPPEQRLSWQVSMLPFIEQDKVFKQFDLTRGPGDPRNEKPASSRIRYFVCPSSGEREYDNDTRTESWKSPTPLTHYVGVAGVGADAAELPLKHPRAGVFGCDRRTLLPAGIPDGTGNTLLVIETAHDPGHWAYGGPATVRGFEPDAVRYIGPGQPFGGFHTGTPLPFNKDRYMCTTALADGSVRSFTSATDPAVLEALATAGGKEPLPANW